METQKLRKLKNKALSSTAKLLLNGEDASQVIITMNKRFGFFYGLFDKERVMSTNTYKSLVVCK